MCRPSITTFQFKPIHLTHPVETMNRFHSLKPRNFTTACTALLLACLTATTANAANIAIGDVTTTLWPGGAPFTFFDTAATGGGDTTPGGSISFDRSFGALSVGSGGSRIIIRGIGWASAGASAFGATNVIGTITYLGANGTNGGGDDVVIGRATNNVTPNVAASEWTWVFDSPITNIIDGASNIFRINMTRVGTFNMSFKTTSAGSGQPAANAKVSAAGSSTSVFAFDPLDRMWDGSLSGTWNTNSLNWTNVGLGLVAYTNGHKVLLLDTLNLTTLRTNITLADTFFHRT